MCVIGVIAIIEKEGCVCVCVCDGCLDGCVCLMGVCDRRGGRGRRLPVSQDECSATFPASDSLHLSASVCD